MASPRGQERAPTRRGSDVALTCACIIYTIYIHIICTGLLCIGRQISNYI